MDAKFWIKAWQDGRTAFHQGTYNASMMKYFSLFRPQPGQKVLVPLCGKTKDMLWLHEQGMKVHGIEWYAQAVEDFFAENRLAPVTTTHHRHTYQNITLEAGDFFLLAGQEQYDFIYDRAALVALPQELRKHYAEVIQRSLVTGGKCLLIVCEYRQDQMDGPPFSVNSAEVQSLYQDRCKITLLETQLPSEGDRFAELEGFCQRVYVLEKN